MPTFQYKARNTRGEIVQGRIEAPSADAVANQLYNTGIIPVDIAKTSKEGDFLKSLTANITINQSIGLVDLILFSRQMYTLLKAGVPIMQALKGLQESTHNLTMARVIGELHESLDAGVDLTTALRRHPQVFSSIYTSLVQVGETTGALQETFLQLATHLEREKATRESIKSAMRYPTFVLLTIGAAIAFINLKVIPAFAGFYGSVNVQLPWPTRLLMATSDLFVHYWHVMLVLLVLAVLSIRAYIRTPEGRYRWDRMKIRIPVIGKIIHFAILGRFARTFSLTIQSGVPLVPGLTVISRAVDNEYIGDRIVQMRNGIERGETITRTAAATGMFPPLVMQMISVGEETGEVDELMNNVGDYYEREVDYRLQNLSEAIQPILIFIVGGLVLILALGVFLPMWDLAGTMLQRR